MRALKKGIILLLCCIMSSSMVALAGENQEETKSYMPSTLLEGNSEEDNSGEGNSGMGNAEEDSSGEEDSENDDPEIEQPEPVAAPEIGDAPGWKEIDNNCYYYDQNKRRADGWRKINKVWYYFDGNDAVYPGIMLKDTVRKINGKYYLFNTKGVMLTGWIKRTEGWYYANSDGSLVLGWKKSGGKWYYLDGNNSEHVGLMVENKNMLINGKYYGFNANGAMLTGWFKRTEGWYYANSNGALALGWKKSGGKWYYLDGNNSEHVGLMAENKNMLINGKYYGFNSKGAMFTGWFERTEGWYYANSNGSLAMKWKKSGNKWYYLNPNDSEHPGRMLSNITTEIDGLTYTFVSTGAMKTGWDKVDGKTYYYDTYSGQLVSGWKKISGKWYYFAPDTKEMVSSGFRDIEGKTYYLNTNGIMATYWKQIDNQWYYFGGSGAMQTGWKMIDGFWYYFYLKDDPNGGTYGAMACNTTIDGYKILANGTYLSPDQTRMNSRAQGYSSRTGYLIMVDTTNCKMGVYSGSKGHWNLVKYWSCSPGAPATPTVKGVFSVGSKGSYFDSGNLRLYWYTQFYGDYLIHSVCYLHDGTPADLRTGLHLSHGCVRLQIDNAKWVYDHIPRGTTVVCY